MALSVKNFGGGGSIGAVENLLVPTLGTETRNGITCTSNGDGTFTLSGTSTANALFLVGYVDVASGQSYKLSGCPKGGNIDNGYFMYIGGENGVDEGNGQIYNVTSQKRFPIQIGVRANNTIDNLVFKPMLTTNTKATYKEFVKRVGGFTNLLVPTQATETINGITCTNNGDGTYTFNGTNTRTDSKTYFYLIRNFPLENGKTYKLVGCPRGGSSDSYVMGFSGLSSADNGDGTVYTSDGTARSIVVAFAIGYTAENLVFKPMLTESLLPEYYDFVKGVEDIKAMLGCTKVAVSEYTPTSDIVISTSTGSPTMINHSLGQKPTFVAMISDIQLGATRYLISCAFYRNSNNNNNVAWGNQICGNSTYGNINLYLIGSKLSTTQISLQTNTSNVYLKGGTTYKIIAMA